MGGLRFWVKVFRRLQGFGCRRHVGSGALQLKGLETSTSRRMPHWRGFRTSFNMRAQATEAEAPLHHQQKTLSKSG